MRYVYDIKFEMLQVRQNEISLRKWSGGTAQLRNCAPQREHWFQGKINQMNLKCFEILQCLARQGEDAKRVIENKAFYRQSENLFV